MKFLLFISLFANSMSVDEIYNRILTDKFFRGGVADNIIENKKHLDVVSGQFYTYSELRYAVIRWIEENPKEASKRFSEILLDKGEYNVEFKVYEYKINPRFKELIDRMSDAANKDIMSDEERRIFSSIMFEGKTNSNRYYVDLQEESSKDFENSSISYNYVDLNVDVFSKVSKEVDFVYNYLKNFDIKDIGDIIKRCDSKYIEFQENVSLVKGNRRISPSEGERLERVFSELKNLLILRFLVVKYRNLQSQKPVLYQKYERILNYIEKEIENLSRRADNYEGFKELYTVIKEVDTEFKFFKNIENIYKKLDDETYSCFLDYIIRKIDFTSKYKKIHNKKVELISYFSKILYANFKEFNDEKIIHLSNKIKEAEEIIDLENKIKLKHRKIQFIFFDNILCWELIYNPGLKFAIKEECVRIK